MTDGIGDRRELTSTALTRFLLIATLAFVLTAAPSGVVNAGEDDDDHHSHVGAVIGPGFDLCSGPAINPTVFVNAAHSFDTPGQRVTVGFDSERPLDHMAMPLDRRFAVVQPTRRLRNLHSPLPGGSALAHDCAGTKEREEAIG